MQNDMLDLSNTVQNEMLDMRNNMQTMESELRNDMQVLRDDQMKIKQEMNEMNDWNKRMHIESRIDIDEIKNRLAEIESNVSFRSKSDIEK